eukprot:11499037-Karenia_brevis.AAC.1
MIPVTITITWGAGDCDARTEDCECGNRSWSRERKEGGSQSTSSAGEDPVMKMLKQIQVDNNKNQREGDQGRH